MHFCSKFGNCNFNWWWVMARTSSKWGKLWLWSSIWPWRAWSIVPQNNRDLNQGLLHLWSKFGDPSLNNKMSYCTDKLGNGRTDGLTEGLTDRQTQATTIPEGQNWPRVIKILKKTSPYQGSPQGTSVITWKLPYEAIAADYSTPAKLHVCIFHGLYQWVSARKM